MSSSAIVRLSQADLQAITARVNASMNDDGLRAWYRNDVTVLLSEVHALRSEASAVLGELQSNAALDGYEGPYDALSLVLRLRDVWQEHEDGVWATARQQRVKDRLKETTEQRERLVHELSAAEMRCAALAAETDQLRSQLMDASGQLGRDKTEYALDKAKLERRAEEAERELALKHAEATRALSAMQEHYVMRVAAFKRSLTEALGALGS